MIDIGLTMFGIILPRNIFKTFMYQVIKIHLRTKFEDLTTNVTSKY